MRKRNFEKWLGGMKDNITSWSYYVDFARVYENVMDIKVELNILNSLIGSKDIENEFIKIVNTFPTVLKAIPILLAKREKEIQINDVEGQFNFDFRRMNYAIEDYVLFMRRSGLFDLLENHLVANLFDYVQGVEVGMDTNARKNRMGHLMENIVESFLLKADLEKDKTYFKEMKASDIEKKFHIDLGSIINEGKVSKRFDFVFLSKNGTVNAVECNFYSSQGSKLNETARSYKTIALEAKNIPNFNFVWITDGKGWLYAKHNLEETFEVMTYLFNLNDLENGAIDKIIDIAKMTKFILD